jgi:formate/nitrite transporter FocA (FNT family)
MSSPASNTSTTSSNNSESISISIDRIEESKERSHRKKLLHKTVRQWHRFESSLMQLTKPKQEKYRTQLGMISSLDKHCSLLVDDFDTGRQIVMAIIAGFLITLGDFLGICLAVDLGRGMQDFMIGLGFVFSITTIVLTSTVLLTEMHILIPIYLIKSDIIGYLRVHLCCGIMKKSFEDGKEYIGPHHKQRASWKTIFHTCKLWLIALVGNTIGCITMGVIINVTFLLHDIKRVEVLAFVVEHHTKVYIEYGTRGWFSLVLSGIMAAAILCTALLLASRAVTITGKIFALFLPVLTFPAVGFQHAPGNIGLYSIALFWRWIFGYDGTSSTIQFMRHISVGDIIAKNIIPVHIGNVIGGVGIALTFLVVFNSDEIAHDTE